MGVAKLPFIRAAKIEKHQAGGHLVSTPLAFIRECPDQFRIRVEEVIRRA